MRKPEFEQMRRQLTSTCHAIRQQDREPYRLRLIELLEETGSILVQKARKDGHDDALIEVHGSWVGTDFNTRAVKQTLAETWSSGMDARREMHWVEDEDEVVTLDFACELEDRRFLTGRVKITV